MHELNKPTALPPPICLNMEPQDNQEFLEANVTVPDNQLALSLNNKAVVDAFYRLPPLPTETEVSRAANRRVTQGALI